MVFGDVKFYRWDFGMQEQRMALQQRGFHARQYNVPVDIRPYLTKDNYMKVR